jgi:hypothetical protein
MKWRRISIAAALILLAIFSLAMVHADTLIRGFKASNKLEPGIIVSLSKNKQDTVEIAPGNDSTRIYGVVIDPNLAPVTVQLSGEQVFVATGGNYPVLVSDQNGPIKPGDYITISSTNGVGAKVGAYDSLVLGRAIEGFDGKSAAITHTADGHYIGRVTVSIIPGKNPLIRDSVAIPAPLKRMGEAIAGKNVSALRIWASLAVFVITAIIAISVLTVGIRSSITAIGRNPLSKKPIMLGLTQLVIMAFLILLSGTIGVYLLLKA